MHKDDAQTPAPPALDPAREAALRALIDAHEVVLFMKGRRESPQCGFSAQAVSLLGAYLGEFHTVDVLADPALREDLKQFSDWPTIPQLYVKGEFVGGVDILQQLFEDGDLAETLGRSTEPPRAPTITLSPAAAAAIGRHLGEGQGLRLTINARYQARLDADQPKLGDYRLEQGGVLLLIDRASALRAEGVQVDFLPGAAGGFKVNNPNAPAEVQELDPLELVDMLERAEPIELVDVRTPEEVEIAHLEGGRLLDDDYLALLRAMPKDAPILCYCHTGVRSRAVAKQLVREGFTKVYNLEGGIDAWALYVDNAVPRY